jgi:hypothetical protein
MAVATKPRQSKDTVRKTIGKPVAADPTTNGTVTKVDIKELPTEISTTLLKKNKETPIALSGLAEVAVMAKVLVDTLGAVATNSTKAVLLEKGFTHGISDHGQFSFSGGGGPSRVINYDKFMDAARNLGTKKFPVTVRNAFIKVAKTGLEKHFSETDIDKMCDNGPPSSASFKVEPLKSLATPLRPSECIARLHQMFQSGEITDEQIQDALKNAK